MSDKLWLNRRAFIRTAGTALAGAAAVGASLPKFSEAAAPEQSGSMKYDFDTIYDRHGTNSAHWDGIIARYGKENIEVAMGVADMDFKCAPAITNALRERIKHENWGYLMIPKEFYQEIANWNKRRYGLDIDPEWLTLTDGVHPGLVAALSAFAPKGSKVILTTSTYSGFYGDVRNTDTIASESPMHIRNGVHSFDFDDLEQRMKDHNTDTMILCNPQNPTGNCWSQEDMLRIGRMALEHRIVVLADEIHCDFVTKGNKYTPFASLPDKDVVANSVTFKALSKTFSLAAMKVAWYFSTNPEYRELVRAHTSTQTNTLGMVANMGALTEGEEWFDQLLPYIDGNHDFAAQYINEKIPGISYTKAQGTYLAWLDVSGLADKLGAAQKAMEESKTSPRPVKAADIVQRWIIDNAHVYTNSGSSYGPGGENHLRMNLGTSRKLIQLALDNIAAAVQRA